MLSVDIGEMIKGRFLHFSKAAFETLTTPTRLQLEHGQQTPSLVLGLGSRGRNHRGSPIMARFPIGSIAIKASQERPTVIPITYREPRGLTSGREWWLSSQELSFSAAPLEQEPQRRFPRHS